MSSIFILTSTKTMGLPTALYYQILIFFQTSTGKRREELSGKKLVHAWGVMLGNLLMVKLWYQHPAILFTLKGRSPEKLMFPFAMWSQRNKELTRLKKYLLLSAYESYGKQNQKKKKKLPVRGNTLKWHALLGLYQSQKFCFCNVCQRNHFDYW